MALVLRTVLISDEIDEKCVRILQNNGIAVTKNTKLSKDELTSEIAKYDGLIVRSSTKVDAAVIEAGKHLSIIGRAGTGVDNIDCQAATKHGIIVMNTPGGNTLSAAEHTCGLLLAMARHIAEGTCSLRKGQWNRKRLMGSEVLGKTLGIIGLGKIGKEVALRMQAFGMKTIGFDPIIPASEAAKFGVESMSLEDMWPRVDYITVHTPLIPQTKNLICTESFNKCKKGVKVINCARGGIINESDLLDALKSGQCGGAALDVFEEEPPTNMELIQHEKVTCTPHLGASTVEAQSRVAEEIAQQFVDLAHGRSLIGAINANALTNALSPDSKPWIELARTLGVLGAKLLGYIDGHSEAHISTEGPGLRNAGIYLQTSMLVGLLKAHSQNGLNMVSAASYAKEVGVQSSAKHMDDTASEALVVAVQNHGGAIYRLKGTVGGSQALLLAIGEATFRQGVNLQGDILIYKGQDSPQTLTAVTKALSEANTTVLSFASSTAVNGESWGAMHISPSLHNLDLLKPYVNYTTQVHF